MASTPPDLRWGRRINLALAVICLGLLLFWVNWTPDVDPNYFFSSHDPQLIAQKEISNLFPETGQFVFQAKGPIHSEAYQKKIGFMTQELADLPGVMNVFSITQGPGSLEKAMESPFWRRVLLVEGGQATNLFVFTEAPLREGLISNLEKIKAHEEAPDFELVLSGAHYVSELIRRSLLRDLRLFSASAFLIFGGAIWFLFRSPRMVLGTVVACINATGIALVISQLLGVRIGLLTANLTTILFVLTLSPILFLTSNWKYLLQHPPKGKRPTHWDAARLTFNGSFWSMLTTLLGFLSLLFTRAVPLRSFGVSGAIGTVLAFSAAYLSYLWFLPDPKQLQSEAVPQVAPSKAVVRRFFEPQRTMLVFGVIGACLLTGAGLFRLNTDPSLLDYFSKKSQLGRDLSTVDQSIGSSPLQVVVRDKAGGKLNTTQAYQRLWSLHQELEKDPSVGSAISLPLIMAEAKRQPIVSLLPWEWLFELMERTGLGAVSRFFVTEDRERGFFLLMMRESARGNQSRLETIERLENMVESHGFKPELVGGVYALQGRMAHLVTSSLLQGLVMLVGLFFVIAGILSRSVRVGAAVAGSLTLIPLWMLGIVGHLRLPFDIISSPATNISVGMGVDAMLYTLVWVRRHSGNGKGDWSHWVEARVWLWQPILFSALIIGMGFGIFAFSTFPPTQRFGLSVFLGTIIAPVCALFVLPALVWVGKRSR